MSRLLTVSPQLFRTLCCCCCCYQPTAFTCTTSPRYFHTMGIVDELEAQWNNRRGSGVASSSSRSRQQMQQPCSGIGLVSASSLGVDQTRPLTTAAKANRKTPNTAQKTAKAKSPSHKSNDYISLLNSIRDQSQSDNTINKTLPDLSPYPLQVLQVSVHPSHIIFS